jgi:hypothetical protein
LAKKGIVIPQNGSLSSAKLPKGISSTQLEEAIRSCVGNLAGSHLRNRVKGLHNPLNNSRFHAVLASFAACLRQNGVNVGEPNTSGKGPIFNTKGLNTGSPQFKAAAAKCRSTLLHQSQATKASPGVSKTH